MIRQVLSIHRYLNAVALKAEASYSLDFTTVVHPKLLVKGETKFGQSTDLVST